MSRATDLRFRNPYDISPDPYDYAVLLNSNFIIGYYLEKVSQNQKHVCNGLEIINYIH